MALFQSDVKETVRRLSAKDFASAEERDELLGRLATSDGVRARDVVWMLFRPDRALRDAAVKLLTQLGDPDTLDVFVAEARGKPEPAMRAAAAHLSSLGIGGVEQRVAQLLAPPARESKDSREMQSIGRRILLETPVTPATEPFLWDLAAAG